MPVGNLNNLIAKLNDKAPDKDETATWHRIPNREMRRRSGRPFPRTGQGARFRRKLREAKPHWARVNHVQHLVRKAEARQALASDRRLLTAVLDAEKAVHWAELAVLRAEWAVSNAEQGA